MESTCTQIRTSFSGHPDDPLSWEDLHAKFDGLVEPVLGGKKTVELFDSARAFGRAGSLQQLTGY
jgi:hypothetical protein